MKKYRIRITYQNHNYRVDLLEPAKFLWWSYWRSLLTQRGPLRAITPYVEQWCRDFRVNIGEVEDNTK